MRLAFSYAFNLPVLSPGESLYKKKIKKKKPAWEPSNTEKSTSENSYYYNVHVYMYGKN